MAEIKFYLAACCILKDEDPFIEEWLTYHSLLGVEHFFVYDNDSQHPLNEHPVISKYIEQGKITLCSIHGKTMQLPAYAHCLDNFGNLCKWVAFIDLDEFICTDSVSDIRLLLSEYEDYACLALNWLSFSSSRHVSRPEGLVIKNYQELVPDNKTLNLHIKSIIQPDKTSSTKTAHSFIPKSGTYAVDETFRPLPPGMPVCPTTHHKIWVNHYLFKSQQDFARRSKRGRADIDTGKPTINYDDFYHQTQKKGESENRITRFAEEVENWMKQAELPGPILYAPPEATLQEYLTISTNFIKDGKINEAELVLCQAALYYYDDALLWVMRGYLARLQKDFIKAERFLYHAFRYKEVIQAYQELLDLRIAENKIIPARAVLYFLQCVPTVQTSSPEIKRMLAVLDKMLNPDRQEAQA